MTHEGEPDLTLPEHVSVVSEEGLTNVLAEVTESKRLFAIAVKAITDSGPDGFATSEDIEIFLRPFLSRTQHADGMVAAMDLLAPRTDGSTWDSAASAALEQKPANSGQEEPLVVAGIRAAIDRKRTYLIEERGILAVSIGRILEPGVTYHLEELELPHRAYRVLKENGIQNLEMLSKLSIDDLRKMDGMGAKSIEDILEALDWGGWLIPEMSRTTPEESRLLTRPDK